MEKREFFNKSFNLKLSQRQIDDLKAMSIETEYTMGELVRKALDVLLERRITAKKGKAS